MFKISSSPKFPLSELLAINKIFISFIKKPLTVTSRLDDGNLTFLTGCLDADARPLTAAQKNAIQERIKPFSVVSVIGQGVMQVAAIEELPGKALYAACSACHGANGGGGIGPKLSGKTHEYIMGRLKAYKAGETIGAQSSMMWGNAARLSDEEIHQVTEYIETL